MDEKEAADAIAVELLQKYPGLADMVQRGLIRLPLKRLPLKPNGPGAYPRLESVTPPAAPPPGSWTRSARTGNESLSRVNPSRRYSLPGDA